MAKPSPLASCGLTPAGKDAASVISSVLMPCPILTGEGLSRASSRLPPMRGHCFHNRVIVSAEALSVLAGQISSFENLSAPSRERA